MSIKDNRNNDVYDVLGMSEEFKERLIENCFDKIDSLEHPGVEVHNEKNTNVWESSKKPRRQKSDRRINSYIKGAVAVFVIGGLAYMLSLGVKYYYKSYPLKNGSQTNPTNPTNQTDPTNPITFVHGSRLPTENLDHYSMSSSNSMCDSFERTDNEWYEDSLNINNKKCYNNGKLKGGYEEREFSYIDTYGYENKFQVVGKDFVIITKEEALNNAQDYVNMFTFTYSNGTENTDIDSEIESDDLSNKILAFAGYEYIYYIQDDSLYRLTMNDEVKIWKDNSCSYASLGKVDGHVYAMSDGKKKSFEHNFEDVNVIKPTFIQITDENGEFINKTVYQKFFVKDNDHINMYYVDADEDLRRMDNVHITNIDEDTILANDLYRVYLEGASNYMGVDSLSANDKKIASDVLINEIDIKNNKLIATSNTYIWGGNTIIEHKKDSFITYDK